MTNIVKYDYKCKNIEQYLLHLLQSNTLLKYANIKTMWLFTVVHINLNHQSKLFRLSWVRGLVYPVYDSHYIYEIYSRIIKLLLSPYFVLKNKYLKKYRKWHT